MSNYEHFGDDFAGHNVVIFKEQRSMSELPAINLAHNESICHFENGVYFYYNLSIQTRDSHFNLKWNFYAQTKSDGHVILDGKLISNIDW